MTGLDWEQRYDDRNTPWDQGRTSLPLAALIAQGRWPLEPDARIWVPGCGRGYDVLAMARLHGHHVTGVDLAANALEDCRRAAAAEGLDRRVELRLADMLEVPVEAGAYDAVYEHTSYCAIHPSRRAAWTAQVARALRPGGFLIGLMFPVVDKPDGPPYAVDLQALRAELAAVGLAPLGELWPSRSSDRRRGKEKWVFYEKKP
ncbi:MAG: methyltransferase domain-containing protein [Planctomycetota bacterium]